MASGKKVLFIITVCVFLAEILSAEYFADHVFINMRLPFTDSRLLVRGEGYFTSISNKDNDEIELTVGPKPVNLRFETSGYNIILNLSQGKICKAISGLGEFCDVILQNNEIQVTTPLPAVTGDAINPLSNGINPTRISCLLDMSWLPFPGMEDFSTLAVITINSKIKTPEGSIIPLLNHDGVDIWRESVSSREIFFKGNRQEQFKIIHEVSCDSEMRSLYDNQLLLSNSKNSYHSVECEPQFHSGDICTAEYTIIPDLDMVSTYLIRIVDLWGNELFNPDKYLRFIPDSSPPVLEDEIMVNYELDPGSPSYAQKLILELSDYAGISSGDHGNDLPGAGPDLPVIVISQAGNPDLNIYSEWIDSNTAVFSRIFDRGSRPGGLFLVLKDLVGNTSDRMPIDDLFTTVVPQCYFDSENTVIKKNNESDRDVSPYILEYSVFVGESFLDPVTGIEKIEIKNVTEGKEFVIYERGKTGYAISEPDYSSTPAFRSLSGFLKTSEGDLCIGDLNTSNITKLDLTVTLSIDRNEEGAVEPIDLIKPDICLNQFNNNVFLGLYKGQELIDSMDMSNLYEQRKIYTNEELVLKIDNAVEQNGNGWKDLNSDFLELRMGPEKGNSVQIKDNLVTGQLELVERASGNHVSGINDKIYFPEVEIIFDKTIDLPDEELFKLFSGARTLEGTDISTNKFPDRIAVEPEVFNSWDSNDESGLKSVSISIEDERGDNIGNLEVYNSLDEFTGSIAPDSDMERGLGIGLVESTFPEIKDGNYRIVLEVRDMAGNEAEAAIGFILDRSPVDFPDELLADNVFRPDKNEYPLTGYDYNHEQRELTLSLHLISEYWKEEINGNLVKLHTVPSFPSVEGCEPEVYYNSEYERVDFKIRLTDSFKSNELFECVLEIHDAAGNRSCCVIDIYLPAVIDREFEKFVKVADEGLDSQGNHFFKFDSLQYYNPGDIALYRIEGSEGLRDIRNQNGFYDDVNILSHEEYRYRICGINGAGFESKYSGFLDSAIVVKNIEPLINKDVDVLYHYVHRSPNELFIGPESKIEIYIFDGDINDSLSARLWCELQPGSNRIYLSEYIHSENSRFKFDLNNLPEERKNGDVNTFGLEFYDSWINHGIVREGLVNSEELGTFVFDDQGPRIEFESILTEGFVCSDGNYKIVLVDSGCGSNETRVEVERKTVDEEYEFYSSYSVTDNFENRINTEGIYKIEVSSSDFLGNLSVKKIEEFAVDLIPPDILSIRLGEDASENNHISRPLTELSMEYYDTFSGVKYAFLRFVDDEAVLYEKTLNFSAVPVFGEHERILSEQLYIPYEVFKSQGEYSIQVKLVDFADNENSFWTGSEQKLIVDTEAPLVKLDMMMLQSDTSVKEYGGIIYTNDPFKMSALKCISKGSFIKKTWWEISRYTESVKEILETGEDLESLLTFACNNGTYCLKAFSTDIAGNIGVSDGCWFVLDYEAPVLDDNLYRKIENTLRPGDSIDIPLSISNEEGGFSWFITVGTPNNPVLISEKIEGNSDGIIELFGEDKCYRIVIPQVSDDRYIARVKAVDLCGNESSFNTVIDFMVKEDGDYVIVDDGGPFLTTTGTVFASVKSNSSRQLNCFRYRLMEREPDISLGENCFPVSEWYEGTSRILKVETMPGILRENSLYFFEVEAQFSDGFISPSARSSGFIIDITPPVIENFYCSSFINRPELDICWKISETNGLSEVRLKVVKELKIDDMCQFVDIGTIEFNSFAEADYKNIQASFLEDLNNGDQVFAVLTAVDYAGNHVSSKKIEIIIDNTPPVALVISDQGEYINPNRDDLKFWLDGKPGDEESGIKSVQWRLIQSGCGTGNDDFPWVSLAEEISSGFYPEIKVPESMVPENGKKVVMELKIENEAGLEQRSFSNGIIIDESMPGIACVRINSGENFTENELVAIETFAHDEIGEIKKVYYMYSDKNELDVAGIENYKEQTESLDSFQFILDDNLINNKKLYFSIIVEDGGGNRSLPFLSKPIVYKPERTEIRRIKAGYENGIIKITWMEGYGALQNVYHDVKLEKDGAVLAIERIGGSQNSWETEFLSEGEYRFVIKSVNSASKAADNSLDFLLDFSPPVISEIEVSPYVSSKLDFTVSVEDMLSRVDKYRYRLGGIGGNGSISGGWIEENLTDESIICSLIFDELPGCGFIKDGELIFLEVTVKDYYGNWSEVVIGEESLIDLTPPEDISIDFDYLSSGSRFYTNSRSEIEGVKISGVDPESGILGYRWYVGSVQEKPGENYDNYGFFEFLEFPSTVIEREGLVFSGNSFSQDDRYRVFISMKNRAGVYSEWVKSDDIFPDYEPPKLSGYMLDGVVGWDTLIENGMSRPVVNDDFQIGFDVNDNSGEIAEIQIIVIDSENKKIMNLQLSPEDIQNNEPLTVDVTDIERGLYIMEIKAMDAAGNETPLPEVMSFRYNSPPVIELPEVIITNPGRSFVLDGDLWNVHDDDGIYKIEYELKREGFIKKYTQNWGEKNIDIALYHGPENGLPSGKTSYDLDCRVFDNYGMSADYKTIIEVVNTENGKLCSNETWCGNHLVTGRVTIPDNTELTLLDGTEVRFRTGAVEKDVYRIPEIFSTGFDLAGLRVEPGGKLIHSGTVTYKAEESGGYWDGVYLMGETNLENITICDALRGFVIDKNSETDKIVNCRFTGNVIGLHLLKTGVNIRFCEFIDNINYGIKEDNRAGPVIELNKFINNGFDFYDHDLTVVDIE